MRMMGISVTPILIWLVTTQALAQSNLTGVEKFGALTGDYIYCTNEQMSLDDGRSSISDVAEAIHTFCVLDVLDGQPRSVGRSMFEDAYVIKEDRAMRLLAHEILRRRAQR